MNEQLSEKLMSSFPILYRKCDENKRYSFSLYGFECGDGWFDMLFELSGKIEKELEKFPEDEKPCVLQVKQKFGELRFYMSNHDEVISGLIEECSNKSITVCEQCGSLGEIRPYRWIQCLCLECDNKLKRYQKK